MAVGKVKWFNDSKGFGMIERMDGAEVFVHYTSIARSSAHGGSGDGAQAGHRTLHQGEEVEFDLYLGPKGPQARNVMTRD